MTPNEASLLAHLVDALNPAWDMPGIWAALKAHRDAPTPFADLAVAAVTAAANPANHERVPGSPNSPERIWFPGPHWPAAARATLPRGPRCEDHPEEDAALCRCCASDVLAGDRPRELIGKHHNPNQAETPAA